MRLLYSKHSFSSNHKTLFAFIAGDLQILLVREDICTKVWNTAAAILDLRKPFPLNSFCTKEYSNYPLHSLEADFDSGNNFKDYAVPTGTCIFSTKTKLQWMR